MKVTITIPDNLAELLDEVAKPRGVSRSTLMVEALMSYLSLTSKSFITEQLNRVYDGIDSRADPVMSEMSRRTLKPEEWLCDAPTPQTPPSPSP